MHTSKNRLTLKQGISIPPVIIMIFLLVVSAFSYLNMIHLGNTVDELIRQSGQALTTETTMARRIAGVQQSVSRYFSESGDENYTQAISAISELKNAEALKQEVEVLKTLQQLEKLTTAAKARFENLQKEERAFTGAQKEVQVNFPTIKQEQIMTIMELMTKVGNDMRSPKRASQETLDNEFNILISPLPKGDLKFALEDYWDIWAGYTAVYLKLQDDSTKALKSAIGSLNSFREKSTVQSQLVMQKIKANTIAKIKSANLMVLLVSLAALLLGIILTLIIGSRLNRIMTTITAGIHESFVEVDSASANMTTSSHIIADSASSQAASLEEISASLEEVASMARQSADNATQVDMVMGSTKKTVDSGSTSMDALNKAMVSISIANEETFKIINTIEQIAFQTNLLALNAAVEAARAGEAGAGFAVVAEEVRNLAGRSAEAAGNTNKLIDDSTTKVRGGTQMADETSKAYSEISESTDKIATMVTEISAASSEQAVGVDTIKQSIEALDEAAQQNAASSEEMAASATSMQSQARNLESYVQELVTLIGHNVQQGPHTMETPPQDNNLLT